MGARAFCIVSCFLTGAIASSLLSWLGFVIPGFRLLVGVVYGLCALGFGTILLLDDPIQEVLGVTSQNYYAVVMGGAIALVIGLGMTALCWL